MTTESPIEVHTATIPVDHSLFTIFDFFGDDTPTALAIPTNSDWLVSAGPGGALLHAFDRALSAKVTLEIWNAAPGSGSAPETDHVFHSSTGRVMIAALGGSPSDKVVPLPAPGTYWLRAHRIESKELADEGDPGLYEDVWHVQVWPHE